MGCLTYIHEIKFDTFLQLQEFLMILVILSFWIFIICITTRAFIDIVKPKRKIKLLDAFLFDKKNSSSAILPTLALALLVLPYLPASNIFFTVGFVIAERYLYLSVGGFSLLIAMGFYKILEAFELKTSMPTNDKDFRKTKKTIKQSFIRFIDYGMTFLIA